MNKPTKILVPPPVEIQGRLFVPHQEWWPADEYGNDAVDFQVPTKQAPDRPSARFEDLPREVRGRVIRHGKNDCWILASTRLSLESSLTRYGMVERDRRPALAHRVTWEHFMGPIPFGAKIDHLCEVRRCLNPAHLELVTTGENTRRHHARRASENAFPGARGVIYRTYRRVICPICGEEFQKVRDWHSYCSDKCRMAGHKDAHPDRFEDSSKPASPKPKLTRAEKILARLRQGPATGLELLQAGGGTRYGARLAELRQRGKRIITETGEGPYPTYRLEE